MAFGRESGFRPDKRIAALRHHKFQMFAVKFEIFNSNEKYNSGIINFNGKLLYIA